MALTQRLDMRQGQSLVMTPQLQQAIKLLQLSNIELAAYVDQELERNPLLERDDSRRAPHATNGDAPDAITPAGESEGLDARRWRARIFPSPKTWTSERSDLHAENYEPSAAAGGTQYAADRLDDRAHGRLAGRRRRQIVRTFAEPEPHAQGPSQRTIDDRGD